MAELIAEHNSLISGKDENGNFLGHQLPTSLALEMYFVYTHLGENVFALGDDGIGEFGIAGYLSGRKVITLEWDENLAAKALSRIGQLNLETEWGSCAVK